MRCWGATTPSRPRSTTCCPGRWTGPRPGSIRPRPTCRMTSDNGPSSGDDRLSVTLVMAVGTARSSKPLASLRFGAGDGIRCWGSARVLGHGYGCPEHILEVAVPFPEDFFGSGDVAFIERLTCHRQALIEAAQLLHQFLTRSPVLHSAASL